MRPFKTGDMVKIISKSTGRTLREVKENSNPRYNPDEPQKISRIDSNKIITIHGDYYLFKDVKHWHSDIDNLFNKIIEEL